MRHTTKIRKTKPTRKLRPLASLLVLGLILQPLTTATALIGAAMQNITTQADRDKTGTSQGRENEPSAQLLVNKALASRPGFSAERGGFEPP